MISCRKGYCWSFLARPDAERERFLKEVMQQQDLYYSVSLTTRAPRPGEVDGVQYHFVSKEQFEEMIARDEVLEHAEFCGNYYGTPRDAVEAMRNEGKNVILEIEVQGAQQVMQKCPDAVSIFIAPPSMTELEKRLRGRGYRSRRSHSKTACNCKR